MSEARMMTQNSTEQTRILIVDDHAIIRAGLASLLQPRWTICGEAANVEEAIDRVEELKPDVVVLGVSSHNSFSRTNARTNKSQ